MDGFVSYDTLLGKLLLISIAVFVLWISYLMGTIIRIYHVRRRMRDYRRFVRSTYVRFGNPVPPMIMRYFLKEVEAYNQVRNVWPLRRFYPQISPEGELYTTSSPSCSRDLSRPEMFTEFPNEKCK